MLVSESGKSLEAKASLDLADYGFDQNASVVIEAYHRSSGQRFDCGAIGALNVPPLLDLDEVDHSGSVLFRVKVIDNEATPGMLLGSAERIRPRSEDGQNGRKSLFPVLFRDLGHEVWKVEINPDDSPKLILNNALPEKGTNWFRTRSCRGFCSPPHYVSYSKNLLKTRTVMVTKAKAGRKTGNSIAGMNWALPITCRIWGLPKTKRNGLTVPLEVSVAGIISSNGSGQ